MSQVYASLKCTGGNVGATSTKLINPGASVSFTNLDWSVPTGETVSCQICFESFGVGAKSLTCEGAGSYTAKRSCECSDFKVDGSAYSKAPCDSNSVRVSTKDVGGSAGSCALCKPCEYPTPEVWTPDTSKVCKGKEFTQTSKSRVVYGGTTFTNGCASKTKEATGTAEPNWSDWMPDPAHRCGPFEQSRYDKNECMPDEYQPAEGTNTDEGIWLPMPECVQPGVPFTQKFFPFPGCPTYAEKISTGNCSDGYMDTCYAGGSGGDGGYSYECWICNTPGCYFP